MARLDRLKEQVAYLKFWQGIMVVTEISLVGWLASAADTATSRLLSISILGIMVLGVGIFSLHRRIEHRIEQIGEA